MKLLSVLNVIVIVIIIISSHISIMIIIHIDFSIFINVSDKKKGIRYCILWSFLVYIGRRIIKIYSQINLQRKDQVRCMMNRERDFLRSYTRSTSRKKTENPNNSCQSLFHYSFILLQFHVTTQNCNALLRGQESNRTHANLRARAITGKQEL